MKNSRTYYRELGRIDAPVQFDQVMDFSMIQTLQEDLRAQRMRAWPPSRLQASVRLLRKRRS